MKTRTLLDAKWRAVKTNVEFFVPNVKCTYALLKTEIVL
jgi:hypothetical protein